MVLPVGLEQAVTALSATIKDWLSMDMAGMEIYKTERKTHSSLFSVDGM